jgi:hypothetical protein
MKFQLVKKVPGLYVFKKFPFEEGKDYMPVGAYVDIDMITRSLDDLSVINYYHLFLDFCVNTFYKNLDPDISHKQLHDRFKKQFLTKIRIINNELTEKVLSTRSLSLYDLCFYFDQVKKQALEDGVDVELFKASYKPKKDEI